MAVDDDVKHMGRVYVYDIYTSGRCILGYNTPAARGELEELKYVKIYHSALYTAVPPLGIAYESIARSVLIYHDHKHRHSYLFYFPYIIPSNISLNSNTTMQYIMTCKT